MYRSVTRNIRGNKIVLSGILPQKVSHPFPSHTCLKSST
uniref:Uncharacterized protein n=1 Tax=Setaria italica TaxID=4555 RepID=K3Y3U4_SETIT